MKRQKYHVEEVSVECVAIERGQHNGAIIREGKRFLYKGILKNGKFPLWCAPTKKFSSSFGKLKESEQDRYLLSESGTHIKDVNISNMGSLQLNAIREEIREEMKAEFAKDLDKIKSELMSSLMAEMTKAPADSQDSAIV